MSTVEDLAAVARELGDSMNGHPENVDAALPRLESILAGATDPHLRAETVNALGYAWDPRATRIILDRVSVDDEYSNLRFILAQVLPNGVDRNERCWNEVVDALVTLSGDQDADIRDWACFGLGQIEADIPQACDALAARLTDPDDDARCEAVVALARAGDSRVLEHLERRLAGDPDRVFLLEVKAAGEIADPVLHPLLLRLSRVWGADQDKFTSAVAFAIARCRPEAPSEAQKVERALEARFNKLIAAEGVIGRLVGRYPRTRLTALDAKGDAVPGADWFIWRWPDHEPSTYPLEDMAGHFQLSLLATDRYKPRQEPQ